MLPLAVMLAVTAAAPTKIAVPDWKGVNVPDDLSRYYASEVARALREESFEVVTSRDITTLLGFERQKQLLGCAGESSCIAELGNALGCDAVLVGDLARLDETYRGSLRIISPVTGALLAEAAFEASGQRALVDALEKATHALASKVRPAGPRASVRKWAFVPLGVGVLLAVAGAIALGIAGADYGRIPSVDEMTGLGLVREGKTAQLAAGILGGTALTALLVAGAVFLFGGGSEPVGSVNVASGAAP
jgi:hypothetical protein